MRLIRTLVLLGTAGLFLPSPPEDPSAKVNPAAEPSTLEMLSSAGSAASDAWSFCNRQPEVCGVAGYLAGKLQAKAVYSASLLWGWTFDEKPAARAVAEGPYASITVAGDTPVEAPPGAAPPKGQSTLQLDDMIPAWRGPGT